MRSSYGELAMKNFKKNWLFWSWAALFPAFSTPALVNDSWTVPAAFDLCQSARPLTVEQRAEAPTYPQFYITGLLQARYLTSLTAGVNVEGKTGAVANSFTIKYANLRTRVQISPQLELAASVELAEFREDPKAKVLENAYLKYTFHPQAYLMVGQFRPLFGLEQTYPIDVAKSLDRSNQYAELGKLGWAGFQIGAAIGGSLPIGASVVHYALSVVNGTGKNVSSDKDNGKQYMARLAWEKSEKHHFSVGLSGGVGRVFGRTIYSAGIDGTGNFNFGPHWSLELQVEAKQAVNHAFYYAFAEEARPANKLREFLMRGVYFLPHLRYLLNYRYLHALEASCRYEYIDTNLRLGPNARHTIMPMLGFELISDYGLRLQIGAHINYYSTPTSTAFNSHLLVIQVQGRF